VLSLIAAYAAAIAGAVWGGDSLAARLELPALLGPPLLGGALFLAVFAVLGAVGRILVRRERDRTDGSRSPGNRLVGGLFGCLRGTVVVLLLGFAVLWLDALRAAGRADLVPAIASSRGAAVTAAVVEAGVASAMSDAGAAGRFTARLAARPADSLGDLQAVLDSSEIAALQGDRLFWTYVETGAVDTALNRASYRAVESDAGLRGRLVRLGLVDAAAAEDPRVFRAAAEATLRELGPRLRGLREDPELQRLMADPEIAALVQRGDTLGLLGHPGFRGFVAQVASR
jgi:hypothetical protein